MWFLANGGILALLAVGLTAFALGAVSAVQLRTFLAAHRRAIKGRDVDIAFNNLVRDEHSLTTITDTNGQILDGNDAFFAALGYRRVELVGRKLDEIYHRDDLPISKEIRENTRLGKIWTGETRFTRADGAVMVFQTTVVPLIDDEGRHVKNLSVRVDVTEFRALKNEKTVTMAFDDMLDAVIVHDPATSRIIYMNAFALAEHGWTAEEAAGKTLWDTLYLKASDEALRLYDRVQANGKCTMVLDSPDHDRECEASSYSIEVEGGERRLLTLFRDVTRTMEMQRERDHLVSVITHELRTPLTSIKGALGLMEGGEFGPMSTEAKGLLGIALRNSDRMLELIREILDSERAGQVAAGAEMEPLNLSKAVEAAISSNLGYGAQLGITFASPGSSPNVWIEGNDRAISQILSNLMSNAAKFSPDGAAVDVWVTTDGATAELHVRDYGSGIPEDVQPTLFEPFSGTRKPDRGDVHGSGLGLSIVKTQVEKLGGTIAFETTPGQGTCFHVRFPLLEARHRKAATIAVSA